MDSLNLPFANRVHFPSIFVKELVFAAFRYLVFVFRKGGRRRVSVLLGTSDEAGCGTRPDQWGRPGGQMPLWVLTRSEPAAMCDVAHAAPPPVAPGGVTGRRAGRLLHTDLQPQVAVSCG